MKADEFAKIIADALKEAKEERGKINVLIAGRTGVGKSTLINSIFQGEMAKTGQGEPVTKTTLKITKEGIPLAIWDTRGLEMAAFEETIEELERVVVDQAKHTDYFEHIHVAWICIHEDGRRVEDAEVKLHEMLAAHMPVIGVITKARSDQGFRVEVQRLLPKAKNVVRVRALKEELDEGTILQPMGLEDLAKLTSEVIPVAIKRAFAAAQTADLQQKKDEAAQIVTIAVTAAGAAAATPIPFSDAIALVPIQVGMLAKISSVFGLNTSEDSLKTIVAIIAGTAGATLIGRAIVSNLLKFIPGGGSLLGGAISAATAISITAALGNIYIETLAYLFEKSQGEVPANEDIEREIKRRFEIKA